MLQQTKIFWTVSWSNICRNFLGLALFISDCPQVVKTKSTKTWMAEFGAEELDWSAHIPDLNGTPLRWIRAGTSNQVFLPHISVWSHNRASGRITNKCHEPSSKAWENPSQRNAVIITANSGLTAHRLRLRCQWRSLQISQWKWCITDLNSQHTVNTTHCRLSCSAYKEWSPISMNQISKWDQEEET